MVITCSQIKARHKGNHRTFIQSYLLKLNSNYCIFNKLVKMPRLLHCRVPNWMVQILGASVHIRFTLLPVLAVLHHDSYQICIAYWGERVLRGRSTHKLITRYTPRCRIVWVLQSRPVDLFRLILLIKFCFHNSV